MIRAMHLKLVSLSIVVAFLLPSCSQEETADTDLLQVNAYLDVAELYRNQGQFRAASIEARNAIQIQPDNVDALFLVSQLYMDLGDYSQAITQLSQLNELYPDNVDVKLLLAEAHINSLAAASAIGLLEDLTTQAPQQQNDKNWLLGLAHGTNANFQIARDSFEAVLENDPNHTDALISLSNLEYREGNTEQAQILLDRAIDVDPENLEVKIWQGELALLQQQYPEAEQAFFEALNTMGNYDTMTAKRFSVLQRILIPLQMQQKNAEALRYSQIIAETPQNQFLTAYSSAVSLFQSGEFDEAETALNELLLSAPDHSGSNVLLGMVQYAQGDYAAAEESLTRLANAPGASPQTIKTLAATHLRLGRPESALTLLMDASERYPEDGSVFAMIGATQQSLGNIDDSFESFSQALALQPDSADIHFAMAGSHFSVDDTESAIESLNEAVRLDPNYTPAKNALINFYLSQQDFDAARDAVQTWLNQDADSIENSNFAGRVAFTEGNNTEARQFFESSLRADESSVLARLFLARVDLVDESYTDALSGFNAVLDLEPNNVEALTGILAIGDLNGTVSARVEEVRTFIDSNPAEFTPPLVLSQYYVSKNDLRNALEFAQLAYSRNDNRFTKNTLIEITLRQANVARQQDDVTTAQRFVENALELDDENIQVLTVAAGVANEQGDDDQASAYIARIQELQPGSAYGYEIEGDLFVERGDLENALSSFQQAWNVAITPSIGVKMHQTLSNLDRLDEAERFLNQWHEASPSDGSVNLLLGMTSQQNNEESQAIEYYETAIEQLPDNIVVLNNLAWLYQDSSPARALELSSHAAELYPENPDVLDTHGWILFKQDNTAEAVEVLERALELAPDSPAIAEHLNAARQ